MPSILSWSGLRKARVPQLLGVYAGASFAVLQAGDIFISRLGLPDWTFFGLVVLLGLGLPATVVTALVQSSERTERFGGMATWKNTTLLGVGATLLLTLAVAGFMAARVLGIGPVGTLVAAGVLDREEVILISDFQAPTGDDLLAGAVTEAFRIDLEQSPMVRVVSPGAVRDGLVRMQLPPDSPLSPALARELALREGIKAILMGEINRAGGGSILSVRLVATDSEDALVSFRETVSDSSGVIPAVDRLSDRVRERIGESLRSIRSGEPLEKVSTASLVALRRYSQALQAIDRERDIESGIALLRESIAEDSTFAMAWRKLGVSLMNENRPPEEWEPALTRAFELSDRLTERERYLTRANYHSAVLKDEEGAMRAYRTLLDTYPNDQVALNNLAALHSVRGERQEAMELFRQALALDSTTVIYYTNLLNQELALRDTVAAEATVAGLRSRFPELALVDQTAAMLALARGDYPSAEAFYARVREHPRATTGERIQAHWSLVGLATLRGRLEEAARRLAELVEFQEGEGLSTGPGLYFQHHLQVQLVIQRDTAGALGRMEAFMAANPIPDEAYAEGAHLQAAAFFAQAGALDRGRRVLAEADRISEGMSLLPHLRDMDAQVRALFDFQEGRLDQALDFHRRRAAEPDATAMDFHALAEVHLRAGDTTAAISAFEQAVQMPGSDQGQFDSYLRATVLERLGDLLERSSEPQRARSHYLTFAELWADADADLQPRVEAALDRAARLQTR